MLTPDQQKDWLYSVGPLTCVFEVYTDFGGFGSGVYRKHASATYRGLHSVEVDRLRRHALLLDLQELVGSDVRRPGYFRIAYGECKIDDYGKIGVQYTDPDPVTKRRLHNGNLLESGYGNAYHRNFEMVATGGGTEVKHWWRDNSTPGFPWHAGPVFGTTLRPARHSPRRRTTATLSSST